MSNPRTFVISDTHFFHENIIKYAGRPFHNAHEMNEALVNNWNSVVEDHDQVYHLGDVYMGTCSQNDIDKLLWRLKGRKYLILGNHDNPEDQVLQRHFRKISLICVLKQQGILLSHIPLHPESCKGMVNYHGHIHEKPAYSDQYVNVSVEWTGYTPKQIA